MSTHIPQTIKEYWKGEFEARRVGIAQHAVPPRGWATAAYRAALLIMLDAGELDMDDALELCPGLTTWRSRDSVRSWMERFKSGEHATLKMPDMVRK